MTDKKSRNEKEKEDVIFEQGDTFEDTDIAEDEATAKDKLKSLKAKLAACQKERQEYLDGWQRAKADHLNSKRRAEVAREQEQERQTATFIERLLPLCDSFDMALRSMETSSTAADTWRAGIQQIYNQLEHVLESYNVVVIAPQDETFDPHVHEAVSEAPVDSAEKHNMVLEVLQNGYIIGSHLIRPAKVVVGNYPS